MANAASSSTLSVAKNWMAIVVLLVVPIAATLGYVLWELHTPHTEVRTPVAINRNSLLPHRFAGVCENCHRVLEIGPVEMTQANMRLFNLTTEQRRLLVAGQRVDVPSLVQRIRVPAISPSESLPHLFVGVCTNCHVILNLQPSQAFAQRSMQRAYQPLALGTNTRIAHAGVPEHEMRALSRKLSGFLALGLFLCATVYIGMRFLIRTYPTYKGKFKIKPWFLAHGWCSTTFSLAAILHWYYSDRGNTFLHIALLILIWLTVAGYVLRYRLVHNETQQNVRLLHTQRGLFISLVILLLVGHLFSEFY